MKIINFFLISKRKKRQYEQNKTHNLQTTKKQRLQTFFEAQ